MIFRASKARKLTCRPEEDDSQDQPEEPDDNQVETDGKSCISSGPTKYKPDSDSGDSGSEGTTGAYHQGQDQEEACCCLQDLWQINSESSKVKTKEAGKKGNFKTMRNKRFKMTMASHQSYIRFQDDGQQK